LFIVSSFLSLLSVPAQVPDPDSHFASNFTSIQPSDKSNDAVTQSMSSDNSSKSSFSSYLGELGDRRDNEVVATSSPEFVYRDNASGTIVFGDSSFWKDPLASCANTFECVSDLTTGWKDNSSFKMSTRNVGNNSWSNVFGGEISDIKPGEKYNLFTHMKLNEYVIQSHILLQGYNALSQTWYTITYCPTVTDGPLEWSMFSCQITIPKDTTKIRFVLNAGWSSSPQHKAITWYDGIYMLNTNDESPAFYRNVSNLQSSLESNRVPQADAKGITNISSSIKEFRKINPTLWHVDLNTSGPLTLAFAEPYDEGWLAEIYANGQIIDTVRSKPLYGSINSFNINRISPDPQVMRGGDTEGTAEINENIHVVLRYERQYWFEIGLIISAITVVVSCTIIIISATRNRKKVIAARGRL
jgi:hypothetical protein